MRITYLANLRLPTERAYGIQIAKTCEALANIGNEILLICPFRRSLIKENFFDYYKISRNITFKTLPVIDFYLPGILDKIAFSIKSYISARALVKCALEKNADVYYTRDELVAYLLSYHKKNIIFECHRFSKKKKLFYSRFKKLNFKIVAISDGLKEDLVNFGIKEPNILIARDGVDLKMFRVNIPREEVRRKNNLPLDKKIIMYSGHLFEWKGAGVLLEAARQSLKVSEFQSVLFVFVGGTEKDIREFRKKAEGLANVMILGHRHHQEIPDLLRAADILVLPNRSGQEISERYTSPLKLFEYMASRKPIVASDLLSIREVLNLNNSVLVQPDDPVALEKAINTVLSDNLLAERISTHAYEDVQNYTWRKRVEKIINFLYPSF